MVKAPLDEIRFIDTIQSFNRGILDNLPKLNPLCNFSLSKDSASVCFIYLLGFQALRLGE
jgi:hypothetical protein